MTDGRQPPANDSDAVAALEALLFVAGRPLTVDELAHALGLEAPLVEAAASCLAQRLDSTRGIELRRVAGGLQLVTRSEHAWAVERLNPPRRARLSTAALEVLAVIAYRQPITRAEIEAIRGVNSESPLETLTEYGLITEVGRKEAPGRPILYGTTPEFLEAFGLNDLTDLPPLDALVARSDEDE